jgi:hypothetical protein
MKMNRRKGQLHFATVISNSHQPCFFLPRKKNHFFCFLHPFISSLFFSSLIMDRYYYRKDFFSIRNDETLKVASLSELPKLISVRVKTLRETDAAPGWRIGKQSTFVYDLQLFVYDQRTIRDLFTLLRAGLGDGGILHDADGAEPVVQLWGDQAKRLVRLLVKKKIVADEKEVFVA